MFPDSVECAESTTRTLLLGRAKRAHNTHTTHTTHTRAAHTHTEGMGARTEKRREKSLRAWAHKAKKGSFRTSAVSQPLEFHFVSESPTRPDIQRAWPDKQERQNPTCKEQRRLRRGRNFSKRSAVSLCSAVQCRAVPPLLQKSMGLRTVFESVRLAKEDFFF